MTISDARAMKYGNVIPEFHGNVHQSYFWAFAHAADNILHMLIPIDLMCPLVYKAVSEKYQPPDSS